MVFGKEKPKVRILKVEIDKVWSFEGDDKKEHKIKIEMVVPKSFALNAGVQEAVKYLLEIYKVNND